MFLTAGQKMERISFITCVNDFNKYLQCVKNSLAEKEKDGSVELIAIENSNNQYSIPQALNEGILKATGDILVCCHQDVEFPADWITTLLIKSLSLISLVTNGVYLVPSASVPTACPQGILLIGEFDANRTICHVESSRWMSIV